MGRKHRVTRLRSVLSASAACAVLGSSVLCACSSDSVDPKEQIRRDVLRTNDLAAERRKRLEAMRRTDDHGNLLPSDTKIAGVVLPRGYRPKLVLENEWQYEGEYSYSRLATYITAQLDFKEAQRPNPSTLTFVQARTKGDSQMKPVSVTISPAPGRPDWSSLQIRSFPPLPERRMTKEEIEAELALRRQNAQ